MYSIPLNKATRLELPKRIVNVFVGADAYKSGRITMGKTVVDPHVAMDPHIHENEEEIVFIIRGKGEVIVSDSKEPLLPDTAVVFPIGVVHSIKNTGDEPLEFIYMFNPTFDFGGLI